MINFLLFLVVVLAFLPIRGTKIKTMICAIMVGILVCIFAGTNNSTDQFAYSVLYNDHSYFPVEKGYLLLTGFFSYLGMNYSQFKISIMLVGTLFIVSRIKDLKLIDFRKVILLWMLTGYWFDIEQSRFMIAMFLVLYATKYLERKSVGNAIKYIMFVLGAFSIHTATIAYLFLLMVYLPSRFIKAIQKISVIMTIVFGFFLSNIAGIGHLIYSVIPNERILMWFSFKTRLGWLGPVAVQVSIYLILLYGRKILKQRDVTYENNEKYFTFYETMWKVCSVAFIYMPLYVFSTEFIRLIRGLLIMYFIAFMIAYYFSFINQKLLIFIFNIGFMLLFSIQGLNGIFFYNEYFVENMIVKNDLNSDYSVLMYVLIFIILIYMVTKKNRKKVKFMVRKRQ